MQNSTGTANLVAPNFERIDEAIRQSPFLWGRQLRVEQESGRVTLHGTVTSYFQKQMAQEALRRIDGVSAIDNRLEVVYDA